MDLGLMGIEDLVSCQTITGSSFLSLNSEHPHLKEMLEQQEGNPRSSNGYGSTRPDPTEDEAYQVSKMQKWSDDWGLRSSEDEQILSFSTETNATPQFSFLTGNDDVGPNIQGKNVAFSYYQQQSAYPRCSTGFGSENLNAGSLAGTRGSFTPAQWIELEHQTMIYRYISANVPVPSNLLNSIRKQLTSSGFPGYFSVGSYPNHSYGWGPFHLGFDRTDPEPERCRRTDGKKWRCSKDAVPDHKYCEKHVKKNRPRSRKPVECQTARAVAGPVCSKVVPPVSLPSMSASLVASSGGVSNCVTIAQHQNKGLQPVDRVYDHLGLSMMHPIISSKSKESPFSIPKHQIPMDEYLHPEFGFVSNDSLLNPSEKPFHLSSKSYNFFSEYDAHNKLAEGHDLSKDDGSPQLVSSSSPTGVLQKASFVSVSNNSSDACSPRAENKKTTEGANLYEDLICSAQRLIATSSSIPFG